MTKTAKDIVNQLLGHDDSYGYHDDCKKEADQALKELEAIMQTLVIDYENPLLAGHLSNDRKIERNLLRAEQRQALHVALYGKGN